VHFEREFASAVLNTSTDYPLAVSHILPNQWIVSGAYEAEDGIKKLEACVKSISGEIHGIAMYAKLKGDYKNQLRVLADSLQIPVFKHRALRQPHELPIW